MVLSCCIFYDSRKPNTSFSYLSFTSKGKHFTHRIHSVHCRFCHSPFAVSYTHAIVSENQNKVGCYTGPLICTSWRPWQRKHHFPHKQKMKRMKVAQSQSQRQWQKDEGTLYLSSSYFLCTVIDRLVHSQTHLFNLLCTALNSIIGHFLYTISPLHHTTSTQRWPSVP